MSGGGTDFADSFKYIRENLPDANCVVYLTDMETCSWGEEPECPVLWACYTNRFDAVCKSAPFGEALHVNETSW
jgi:predicted metal-dependent peptidase